MHGTCIDFLALLQVSRFSCSFTSYCHKIRSIIFWLKGAPNYWFSDCHKFVTILWWPWLFFLPTTQVFWWVRGFSSRSQIVSKFCQPYLCHGCSVFLGLMYILWANGSSNTLPCICVFLPLLIFVSKSVILWQVGRYCVGMWLRTLWSTDINLLP